jgi:hypothetical protein
LRIAHLGEGVPHRLLHRRHRQFHHPQCPPGDLDLPQLQVEPVKAVGGRRAAQRLDPLSPLAADAPTRARTPVTSTRLTTHYTLRTNGTHLTADLRRQISGNPQTPIVGNGHGPVDTGIIVGVAPATTKEMEDAPSMDPDHPGRRGGRAGRGRRPPGYGPTPARVARSPGPHAGRTPPRLTSSGGKSTIRPMLRAWPSGR